MRSMRRSNADAFFPLGAPGRRRECDLVDLWISSLMDDNEWNNGSWLRMTTLVLTMIDENDCNWFRMVLITRMKDSN